MKVRSRLVRVVLATTLVSLASLPLAAIIPSYFQGFELDTSGWFPFVNSDVKRVQQATPSVYASNIPAADGDWDGV